jgi:hypothetical protein
MLCAWHVNTWKGGSDAPASCGVGAEEMRVEREARAVKAIARECMLKVIVISVR